MAIGDIHSIRAPIDVDYLAPADTVLTIAPSNSFFDTVNADNITTTLVDVSGRNSVRRVVVVVSGRELL